MKTPATRTPNRKRARPINARLLSQRYWESLGWRVGIVERYVKFGRFGRTFDYCGFADLLAYHPGTIAKPQGRTGTLAIQACAWSGTSTHVGKLVLLARVWEWLTIPGNRLCVMGWHNSKQFGRPPKRKTLWITRESIEAAMVDGVHCEWSPKPKRKKREKPDAQKTDPVDREPECPTLFAREDAR